MTGALGRICACLSALCLVGCGTIFDYSVPKVDVAKDLSTLEWVQAAAKEYRDKYQERANSAATSAQVFEVPIIGSAIATASILAFEGSSKAALGVGLGGGGLAAYETYYAPRDRVAIYASGADAMSCVERLAKRTPSSETLSSATGAGFTSFGILTSIQRSDELSAPTKLTLGQVLTTVRQAPDDLASAIDQINSRIQNRALNASARLDFQKISDDLRKAAQSAAQQKLLNDTAAVELTKAAGNASFVEKFVPSGASSSGLVTVILNEFDDLARFSEEFEGQRQACIGKAS